MRLPITMVAFVLFSNLVAAQARKSYPVKVGEVPNKVLPNEAMYLLPDFTSGSAQLRDGTSYTQLFNYNFLQDEMHFIGPRGDTLAINYPEMLSYVKIDSMVFYYNKGYVRQVFAAGKYKLVLKQQMVQIPDKTRGAYDAASGASSIKTYGSINTENSQQYQLQVKKDVLFQTEFSFYIIDMFTVFFKANKKHFNLLFAEKNPGEFIKQHKTSFNKEEDLKQLLKFCAE